MPKRRPERVLHLANVMNALSAPAAKLLLVKLEKEDPVLAEAVRQLMFRFEDLVLVRDQSVALLWSEVPRATWLVALRGAPEPVKEKLLANLSRRAREMLLDDLDASKPQRKEDVERAQAEVVATTLRLEDEGKLFIDRPGDDEVYV